MRLNEFDGEKRNNFYLFMNTLQVPDIIPFSLSNLIIMTITEKKEQKKIKMLLNKKDSIDKQILYLMKKGILDISRVPTGKGKI
jgi:hypothetical protein